MKIRKLTVGAVVLIALGAAGLGVREFRAAGEIEEAREAAIRDSREVREKVARFEQKLATETKQAEAVESDNVTLASAVQMTQAAQAKRTAEPVAALTREAFDARVKAAVTNAQNAEVGAALSDLLACWELGHKRAGGMEPVHSTALLGAWIKLGENYPPALAVLREKMEKARQRILGSPDDTEPLKEMSSIARALKDEQAMVALLDAIPAGDARRTSVAIYAFEGLIVAKRYNDALNGRKYASMSSTFELNIGMANKPGKNEVAAKWMKSSVVTTAAKNIEVLAGAGDLENARKLAGRVLAFDGSEATRVLLQKHLERAGRPELMPQH